MGVQIVLVFCFLFLSLQRVGLLCVDVVVFLFIYHGASERHVGSCLRRVSDQSMRFPYSESDSKFQFAPEELNRALVV